MTGKLQDNEYRDFWTTRMAKGAQEVAHAGQQAEEQGEYYWGSISEYLPEYAEKVTEFGCGYGRMLQRLRHKYPHALLTGIDIAPAAVTGCWRDTGTLVLQSEYMPLVIMQQDVALCCTVLQHITDDRIFRVAAQHLAICLRPGGRLLMLENTSKPKAAHMREMNSEDYRAVFGKTMEWPFKDEVLVWRGEQHTMMCGVKK